MHSVVKGYVECLPPEVRSAIESQSSLQRFMLILGVGSSLVLTSIYEAFGQNKWMRGSSACWSRHARKVSLA